MRTSPADVMRTSSFGLIFNSKDVPYRGPEDVPPGRLRYIQEIRTSVFGLNINKYCIIKMASTAQQVDDTYERNMYYMS